MSAEATSGHSPQRQICVFSPLPLLTITVEPHGNEEHRVHIHAGGQGIWVARMVCTMQTDVALVGCFGGETGAVASSLARAEGIELVEIQMGEDTPSYIHDRRSGDREIIVDSVFPSLDRHTVDELYSAALGAALAADVTVLTGVPTTDAVDDDIFRRFASDLHSNDATVVCDLHASQMAAVLDGGVTSLKVSDEELQADGLLKPDDATDIAAVVAIGIELRERGATEVVISRAAEPAVVSIDGDWFTVHAPEMQVVDHRGAGDSMTAALAVGLAKGLPRTETIRLAAAAASVNVTRHGLATGHPDTINEIARRVEVQKIG